jgi:hypothetical protein
METKGGSELTIPTQARVMMLGFPEPSMHVINITGRGNIVVVGFTFTLLISISIREKG